MLNEIKALAKANKHSAAKILMKDLVRIRRQSDQYLIMETQLKGMAMQVSNSEVQMAINQALKGATSAMSAANDQMNVKDIQNIMKQFAKESEKMGMKQEMVFKIRLRIA